MKRTSKPGIKFSLTWKISILAIACITAINLYSFNIAIPMIHNRLLQERESKACEEVQTACGTLEQYYELENSGVFTRSEAQNYALAAISDLNYGKDGKGYFWVTDYQPTLLADQTQPDLVGTDVSNVRDTGGEPIYLRMVNICRTEGEGFYKYTQDKGGDAARQIAYVKSFEPWGWTVATAVSSNDITSAFAINKWTLGTIGGVCACVAAALFIIMIHIVVSRPLRKVTDTWEAVAQGDTGQALDDIRSHDEVGAVAHSCRLVLLRMQEMLNIAESMAAGDLSLEIKPQSEKDTLMIAFAQMAENQRNLIGKSKTIAKSVAEASKQLTKAAEQTAQATQQIAATIQQVARGASEQSASLQQTAAGVEQLSGAIDQIAAGAQEQAKDVGGTTEMVKRVSEAITEVSDNARTGAEAWRNTAVSAADGARKTHETTEGMGRIKKSMESVSVRVAELGQRSEEIGNIVATIDDIAAQTNLLALNAAIEAARAGEQGRGFAVVADEVRKLAERSSLATREIAAIVGGIQTGVREAVNAMQQGTKETEIGYKLAADAGGALDEILSRSHSVGRQVEEISIAAGELQELSSGMVEAIDRINHVVEQNAAATEQMRSSSETVSRSVENSAGVSEQNSASAQEVSASVEEMSAQVEETLAAAQSLADMSEELEKSVAVFKTERGSSETGGS